MLVIKLLLLIRLNRSLVIICLDFTDIFIQQDQHLRAVDTVLDAEMLNAAITERL